MDSRPKRKVQESPGVPATAGIAPQPMPERASQGEVERSDAEEIVWAASDGSARILVAKPLLEEVRAAAYRGRFGSRRAGVEVGGVLYGRRSAIGVELEGWAPIDCGWAYGPAFRLTDREKGTLACLMDGLGAQLAAEGNEVVGWFVSRIRGGKTPTESDLELHRQFFPKTSSLLMVLEPRREGDVAATVHLYRGGEQPFSQCGPLWVIDPAQLQAGGRRAAWKVARDRAGDPRTSAHNGLEAQQPAAGTATGLPAFQGPGTAPLEGMSEAIHPDAGAPPRQRGGLWDAVPQGVWRLLALGIVLAIGGAAWLWLFHADVVRPLLLRWTTSASAPPSTVSLLADWDKQHLIVQWDGSSPVFLNPVSVELVFEFATAKPTTVPLRPDEAQRGYFATITNLPPTRVTIFVVPAPGYKLAQSFDFPAPERGRVEGITSPLKRVPASPPRRE